MPWTCQECGRVFARNKQAHSCKSYSLDPLFRRSKPGIRVLYDHLIESVSEFGQLDIRVGPYNISIRSISTFMSVIPEKDHLTIGFIRGEALDEFPVHQAYQQSSKRWSNHVKIESEDEIDEQLITWLRDAYNISLDSVSR